MELKGFIENFAAQFDETDAEVFTAETILEILKSGVLLQVF